MPLWIGIELIRNHMKLTTTTLLLGLSIISPNYYARVVFSLFPPAFPYYTELDSSLS